MTAPDSSLVAQLLLQLREEMTTAFALLNAKVDGQADRFVPRDLYLSERDALRTEIAAGRLADQARSARRQWLVNTMLAVLTVVITVYAATRR